MLNLEFDFADLGEDFHRFTNIQPLQGQRLRWRNAKLAEELAVDLSDPKVIGQLTGALPIEKSLSMVYAGHQFGGYSPRLGDGRGILLGEARNRQGDKIDLHLKGAGLTPFSRQGDGRAVLRSCIREYLASEAMAALNIPTSRALSLFTSDQPVYRERPEPGAMLLRTARTHIRFGHFEYFFYTKQTEQLETLINYCLQHYFPECLQDVSPVKSMLLHIVRRTALMIADWQAIGFQHGVMNTDNMSILGETIDYGPYGFMEDYQPQWISNHSDYEGRYAFEQQPGIALWNLNCLCHCFSNHLARDELVDVLSQYEPILLAEYGKRMCKKLGLGQPTENDKALLAQLFAILHAEQMDYTLFFRRLAEMPSADERHIVVDEFVDRERIDQWLAQYCQERLARQDNWQQTSLEMMSCNPKFILRNYLAQQAIEAAEKDDFGPFERLLKVLCDPYSEHPEEAELAQRTPEWGKHLEISCSS